MHFTYYQKAGDKVFAANPYIIEVKGNFTIVNEEKKKDYLAFETWLSTQSPIYADQSIKDGVYGKELFEEPVWQCYHNNYGWVDIPNAWVKSVEEAKQYDVPARLYIRLKQPEIEANCNGCGKEIIQGELFYTVHSGDDYCKDCYDAIQSDDESSGRVDSKPATPEQKGVEQARLHQWISVGIKMPEIDSMIVIWNLFFNEEMMICFDDKNILKQFKHWYPTLGEPK